MVALPPETPVTTPEEFTVAILVFKLLQTPEGVVFESVTEFNAHIVSEPVIVFTIGNGLTVMVITLEFTDGQGAFVTTALKYFVAVNGPIVAAGK